MPNASEKSGRKKSTPNARIFPARLTVIAGRTAITPASTALNRTRMTTAMVGIAPGKTDCVLLLQRANVTYEILDLLRLQTFAVPDNSGDRVIALPLHIGGAKIPDVVRLPHGRLAFPIGSVTPSAFCLIERLPAALRPHRRTHESHRAQQRRCHRRRSGPPGCPLHDFPPR